MDRQAWLDRRDNRTLRYAGRRLDPNRCITITGEPQCFEGYAGQVAALVACNLLARMTPSVAVAVPGTQLVDALPFKQARLDDVLLQTMAGADPAGNFTKRPVRDSDVVLFLGGNGASSLVHGAGWNSYLGASPSPLAESAEINPFGPALAVIMAVARLFFYELHPPPATFLWNALNWMPATAPARAAPPNRTNLGEIWVVGAGSVGSAALYFLALATRDFSAAIFDHDTVKIENLDRSPIFTATDAIKEANKAQVVGDYLRTIGVERVRVEPYALHRSELWNSRSPGRPDVLVSAANELNVRTFIEEGFPPLQLYATTGRNWQTALIRHVPLIDPCSLCLFPNAGSALATKCATGPMPGSKDSDDQSDDIALPFLSFAAGLMTAAELTKLTHSSYPYCPNRVFLQTWQEPAFVHAASPHASSCLCRTRSADVHRRMLAGTRYETLSNKR